MTQPRLTPLARADRALYQVERALAGALFLLMTAVMFASVMHRVFSRPDSKLAAFVGWLTGVGLGNGAAAVLLLGLTFLVSWLGVLTRRRDEGQPPVRQPIALAAAAGLTAALAASVWLLLHVFPNGLVWGPVISLSCMLWVGFLGASIATYERRHLSLEMADKIWPRRVLRLVRALAWLSAAAMTLFLLALAYLSVRDHYATWKLNPLAGNLLPTHIPKWAIFLIFPYTFAVMTTRFVGQAFGFLPGKPPEADSGEIS